MNITEYITSHEQIIRLSIFFGILSVMGIWEIFAPKRVLTVNKAVRWANNLGLVFLNSLIVRFLFPVAAVGVAGFAHEHGWGLLNYFKIAPGLAILLAIVVMDFIIYLQHVLFHAVPTLWRLHRVHHADLDYDVTTGSRFHTIEIIISMLIKFAVILLLGAPIVAVIIFEVILNAMAMFNHSNVGLPGSLDKVMRIFVVTPDMHRVHHSIEDDETNSNFGFNLSLWDLIFGTYRDQPRDGHTRMTIGIRNIRDPKQVVWITGMLSLPFLGKISGYVINRREWKKE